MKMDSLSKMSKLHLHPYLDDSIRGNAEKMSRTAGIFFAEGFLYELAPLLPGRQQQEYCAPPG